MLQAKQSYNDSLADQTVGCPSNTLSRQTSDLEKLDPSTCVRVAIIGGSNIIYTCMFDKRRDLKNLQTPKCPRTREPRLWELMEMKQCHGAFGSFRKRGERKKMVKHLL
jgi:hypothetical protein